MSRFKFKPEQILMELQIAGDIDRACGDAVCETCGLRYADHPGIEGEAFVNIVVTCDWKIYKL